MFTHPVIATMAEAGAHADFERARRGYLTGRAGRLLKARRPSRTRPRDLGDVAALFWRPARRRSIPLEAIVGTVDATTDFDAGFRPATDRVAPRWQSIARAHHDGRTLPPITVIDRPDGYYVLDGRHRVSVARTLGHADIDAWASPSAPVAHARPPECPTNQERPMRHLIPRVRHAATRVLRANHADERVHFHAGDHGRPFVCENPRCGSPSLHLARC